MSNLLPLAVLCLVCVLLCSIQVSAFSSSVSRNLNVHKTRAPHASARLNLDMRWGLKGKGTATNSNLPEGVVLRDTVPFEIRGFSLPLVVFSIGVLLTASSLVGFFVDEGGGGGSGLSSLGFVYGIPVFLIGLSLWYAEIPPVEVITSEAGDRAWENLSTDTLKKIKQDVTRHRYGDDAHLDSTLEALGLKLPQKKYPKILSITQEETPEGELAFTMIFQSLETPYKVWSDPQRVNRYSKFFGPGISAKVYKENADKRLVALKLTTTTKGEPVEMEQAVATEPETAETF